MSEEKKIIIDEDWKSQVQAEKESLQSGQPTHQQPSDYASSDPQMPPASFEMLLSTLATEAMMALGQLPHPVTGEVVYHPNQAKYLIDTIEVLQQKTKGNLSPLEANGIENLIHQLRMAYLAGPPSADSAETSNVIDVSNR